MSRAPRWIVSLGSGSGPRTSLEAGSSAAVGTTGPLFLKYQPLGTRLSGTGGSLLLSTGSLLSPLDY